MFPLCNINYWSLIALQNVSFFYLSCEFKTNNTRKEKNVFISHDASRFICTSPLVNFEQTNMCKSTHTVVVKLHVFQLRKSQLFRLIKAHLCFPIFTFVFARSQQPGQYSLQCYGSFTPPQNNSKSTKVFKSCTHIYFSMKQK